MGTKKIETKPTMKAWIWLKPARSKAMASLCSAFGTGVVESACGKWHFVEALNGGKVYRVNPGVLTKCATFVYPMEVDRVQESVERPKGPPVKVARIDRSKHPKVRAPKKHVWEPKTVFAKFPPRTTRSDVEQMLRDAVDEINQLGTENAKLKNQITLLKQKAAK